MPAEGLGAGIFDDGKVRDFDMAARTGVLFKSAREPVRDTTAAIHSKRKKKADVAEHPKAFDHVGLLVN